MTLIDGKQLAQQINEKNIALLSAHKSNRAPKFVIFLIGDNKESIRYITRKQQKAKQLGIESELVHFAESVSIDEVFYTIHATKANQEIDGIIVQMPLPHPFIAKHQSKYPESDISRMVIEAIDPKKDIDGLTTANIGKYVVGEMNGFIPATPCGVVCAIKSTGISIEGKHVVIIGRSLIVGKPVGMLMLKENAAVTILHSKVENLSLYTLQADILIVAVGSVGLITSDMVKEGAIVVDVGMSINDEEMLVGDVDFASVSSIASYITPVPGGIGPLTVAYIMSNIIKAYILANERTEE